VYPVAEAKIIITALSLSSYQFLPHRLVMFLSPRQCKLDGPLGDPCLRRYTEKRQGASAPWTTTVDHQHHEIRYNTPERLFSRPPHLRWQADTPRTRLEMLGIIP
jgi:hypothetical protein